MFLKQVSRYLLMLLIMSMTVQFSSSALNLPKGPLTAVGSHGASILKSGSKPDAKWTDDNLTTSGLMVKEIVKSWHQLDYAGDSAQSY